MNLDISKVIAADGTVGIATGAIRRCQLEGCLGIRVVVKWPDGRITYPCTKGMEQVEGESSIYRIPSREAKQ